MSNTTNIKTTILNGTFKGTEATILEVYDDTVKLSVSIFGYIAEHFCYMDDLALTENMKEDLQRLSEQTAYLRCQPSPILKNISPGFAMRIAPIRKRLKEIYGFEFPDAFFLFWQFYQQLPEKSIGGGFGAALNISLGDVFKLFDVDTDIEQFNPLDEFRYYNDPPEFFTLLKGHTDGLHWGYYLDDPNNDIQFQVASYYANDAFEISLTGYNLFEALRMELEFVYVGELQNLRDDPSEHEHYERNLMRLETIRNLLKQYCTADRPELGLGYTNKYFVKREATAPTREGIGIVLPVNLYKPLLEKDHFTDRSAGANYQPTAEFVEKSAQKALDLLEKGFPGAALKLGKDLWTYPLFYKTSYQLLEKAYKALGRNILLEMLKFRKEKETAEIVEFEDALQNMEITQLILSDRNLGTLSPRIKELKNLEKLNLTFNNLDKLPAEISELQQLKELYLGLNIFTEFPKALCNLNQLTVLDFQDNYLHHLPDEIAKMISLKTLCLDNNKFTDFPKSITKLPNLKTLSLKGSQINALPKEIQAMLALEEFYFETNKKIKSISPNIASLKNLKTLEFAYFSENTIQEVFLFPEEFCVLSNLKELSIKTNQILVLPDIFAQLTALETLKINNPILEEIPEVIFQLKGLKNLQFEVGRIKNISSKINQLVNLENLHLYGNSIDKIPDELQALKNLKSINLMSNKLPPSEQEKLKKLFPNTLIQV